MEISNEVWVALIGAVGAVGTLVSDSLGRRAERQSLTVLREIAGDDNIAPEARGAAAARIVTLVDRLAGMSKTIVGFGFVYLVGGGILFGGSFAGWFPGQEFQYRLLGILGLAGGLWLIAREWVRRDRDKEAIATRAKEAREWHKRTGAGGDRQ